MVQRTSDPWQLVVACLVAVTPIGVVLALIIVRAPAVLGLSMVVLGFTLGFISLSLHSRILEETNERLPRDSQIEEGWRNPLQPANLEMLRAHRRLFPASRVRMLFWACRGLGFVLFWLGIYLFVKLS